MGGGGDGEDGRTTGLIASPVARAKTAALNCELLLQIEVQRALSVYIYGTKGCEEGNSSRGWGVENPPGLPCCLCGHDSELELFKRIPPPHQTARSFIPLLNKAGDFWFLNYLC